MGDPGAHILDRGDLDALFAALAGRGYSVIGPTVRDGAIMLAEIAGSADLPQGWTDEQEAGHYRLRRRQDEALFGYNVGPSSPKAHQLPADTRLWRARLGEDGSLMELEPESPQPRRLALLGLRACELRAMAVLDRVLLAGEHPAPTDRARRDGMIVIAAQCTQAAPTCFCSSMGSGPTADSGYDLALTEVLEQGRHYFLLDVATELGAELLSELPHRSAGPEERAAAGAAQARAVAQMGRELDTSGVKEMLYRSYESPRWDEVAERCLSCGNCTMVCPTCFCTTVEDTTDLAGEHVERHRRWDSCFTVDYSHIHGGAVRGSARSRYRQWMTHKLATWIDQFGSSGCVGCGRCITWCPVGIDITAEASALREEDRAVLGG